MVSVHRFRADKPHIFFSKGYWRVNPAGKGVTRSHYVPWNKAHNGIRIWNLPRSPEERLLMPWEFLNDNCD